MVSDAGAGAADSRAPGAAGGSGGPSRSGGPGGSGHAQRAPSPRGLPSAGRCLVMGVVNVTPDSFSDGGAWFGPEAAIARGLELAAQGADIIDVGGESTRPGAQRVPVDEELRRVGPVIRALAGAGVPVSVDTMRAEVAQAALEAGARLVNDVSGGLADPQMPQLVAQAGVPYVVMHWRGHSHQMQDRAVYGDVVSEVCEELRRRVDAVVAEGVDPALIIVDPGLGFAKLAEHNWALLTHLDQIAGLGGAPGFPVLIGASRKRFLGTLLAAPDGSARPFAGSDDATVAITALMAVAGAWCARVHEVPANADAVRVGEAWREAASEAGAMPRSAGPAGAGATGAGATGAGATGAGPAGAAPAGPAGSAAGAGAARSAGRAGGAGAAGEGG